MNKYALILLAVVAALIFSAAPTAHACNGGGCDYGLGYGYLYNSLDYNVPYFAAHPPVYYSAPVPRTYGYSPFAYPPHVMTPEIAEQTQPLDIINPHVLPSPPAKNTSAPSDRAVQMKSQPQPLVINNPFVTPSRAVAASDAR